MILKPPKGIILNRNHLFAHGLVGCWLMNEGGGGVISDLSGNDQGGALQASTSWVAGKFGSALRFASGDYVTIADNVNPTTGVTISVWFKSDSAGISTIFTWNVTSSTSSGIWFALDLNSEANTRIYFYLKGVGNNSSDIPGTRNDGTWHHYAVTYDGQTVCYYIDGVCLDTDPDSGTITYSGVASYIGRLDEGGYPMVGDVDHLILFNRGLERQAVGLLYREPFCMFEDLI